MKSSKLTKKVRKEVKVEKDVTILKNPKKFLLELASEVYIL